LDRFEKEAREGGYRLIAGVDEVGRGPLAGPVIAACVIWSPLLYGLDIADSKTLSPKKRAEIVLALREREVVFGLGLADREEVDRFNVLQASLKAMAAAVGSLPQPPDFLLIDGPFIVPTDIEQKSLIKGDQRSISVAAASVLAKVVRDELMDGYHRLFPEYNFASNKGYPTIEHKQALRQHGYSPFHRLTFRGVAGLRPAHEP
jgi:ribonuclease HII